MVWLKRLRPRGIPRMQVKRPSPGIGTSPGFRSELIGCQRDGRMLTTSRPAIESSLNKHTFHGPPDTHASAEVSPPERDPLNLRGALGPTERSSASRVPGVVPRGYNKTTPVLGRGQGSPRSRWGTRTRT
jgi:hypothetical protein